MKETRNYRLADQTARTVFIYEYVLIVFTSKIVLIVYTSNTLKFPSSTVQLSENIR